MDATYIIPATNREAVEKKLGEMNRKAAKLGTDPISVSFERDHLERIKVPVNPENPDGPFTEFLREWLKATVTGATAKVDGYTFLATLHHTTDGNIISAVPGHEVPREYRNAPSACHHCKTLRRRSATYLVQKEDGQTLQVGRSCLTDFFGHDPHAMAKWAEMLGAFDSWFTTMGEEDRGRRPEPLFSLASFLGHVAAVVRKDGWMSKAKAMDSNRPSTAATAWRLLLTQPISRSDREFLSRYLTNSPTFSLDAQDAAVGATVTEWAETEFAEDDDTRNDYLHNLSVVARSGLVNLRTSGLAASMIAAHWKALNVATEREALKTSPSIHVGEIGERLRGLSVTILGITEMEPNDFGPRQLVKVQDSAGNLFVWFTGSQPNVEPGQARYLTGTVKRHGSFGGVRQTELSRCSLDLDAPKVKKTKTKKETLSA